MVTIICDTDHRGEADALASVALDRGAWPVIMDNEAQVRRGRADTHFPMAPPRNLHQAMTSSDEIIIITNLEWANRFAHVPAVKESCQNNAKICSVEPGMGEWGLTVEKIHAATQRAKDAMAALEGKTECHVTSPKGTDVRVSIEGRPSLEVTSIKRARPDDGPAAAVGGGRVRRGRGPHRGHDRRRRRDARDRARRPGHRADHLEDGERPRGLDRGRRRGAPPARA